MQKSILNEIATRFLIITIIKYSQWLKELFSTIKMFIFYVLQVYKCDDEMHIGT